jgi:SP family sugar porter-like MFS transporter
MGYVWMISLVAALGGLLFGYDWVVIGGAKPFFERYFGLDTPALRGWANSCALVGCLAGAMLAGALSDRYGRKRLLIFAGFLFLATGLGTAMAPGFTAFVVFRILGGVGIGIASNISPMYIAEVSPAGVRGKFVSLNQLTIVIGILAAQIANWLIAEAMPEGITDAQILASWNGQYGWRWMFGAGTVPAVLFLAAMLLVPESPRWLVRRGKDDGARRILARIGGPAYADAEVDDIRRTLADEIERVKFGDLLEPGIRKVLVLGVFLAVLQQWCGINVIFNYAEEVFHAAGYGVSDVLLNIVITGSVNLAFTFVAICTVDRVGRKALLSGGALGLACIYVLVASCFLFGSRGPHVVALVVSAIACYGCTLAPVTWVVLSEIYPNRIRGAAMSVSVFALWAACFVLTYMFPSMNARLGTAWTFMIFAGVCVFGFLFIRAFLPETKGKTLEQIERELVD